MTIEELNEKLAEWIDTYGISEESMNDFANTYATSYEEYNAIWEILRELLAAEKEKKKGGEYNVSSNHC